MSLIAAVLLAVLGLAGLVRAAQPLPSAAANTAAESSDPIVVSGAYVREPANGVNAAAYLTIFNTTATPDVLRSIESGAGAQTSLHIDSSGAMQNSAGLSIPAHGSVTLIPGKEHIMIEKLYGPIKAGQSVNFELSFDKAGRLLLTAPVIAVTAPAPTAAAPR
jgi:copper(I)-binding protein